MSILDNIENPDINSDKFLDMILSIDSGQGLYNAVQRINSLQDESAIDVGEKRAFNEQYGRGYDQNGKFEHIGSITNNPQSIGWVDLRLYINCQRQDTIKLVSEFAKKCQEQGKEFYFKYCTDDKAKRADQIVIYSCITDVEQYLSILKEIEQEYPEIIERCGKPPILTGKLNDWIGIGEEPDKLQRTTGAKSFSEVRTKIMEDVLRN